METILSVQDVRIKSIFEEFDSIVIYNSDLEKWADEAVLCHNDFTPRNLILQSFISPGGEFRYKLVGIIVWELAGFFPASYELSLQDTYLGAKRHVSFYLLLKECMKNLLPRNSSQVLLLQAMVLIFESQQRMLSDELMFQLTSGRDSWSTQSWYEMRILLSVELDSY